MAINIDPVDFIEWMGGASKDSGEMLYAYKAMLILNSVKVCLAGEGDVLNKIDAIEGFVGEWV